MDYTVHGILQARILEWVELFPSPGDPPNPGIKPRSPELQVDSLPAKPQEKPKQWVNLLHSNGTGVIRIGESRTSSLCPV